jgi:hypothetical protein
MRLYEYIASMYCTIERLDTLTLDTLDSAKRTAVCSKFNNKTVNTEYCTELLPSIFNANIIVYLSDYSVHQLILLYGYYMYVQQRRMKYTFNTIGGGSGSSNSSTSTMITTKDSENNSSTAIEIGSLAVSYLKKSTLLFFQRGIWLVSASIFGTIGSAIYPGWGTMAGLSIGETIGCNISDLLIPVDVPYIDSSNENAKKDVDSNNYVKKLL